MFDDWDTFVTRKFDKLETRAWKGVPDAIRLEVWKRRSAAQSAISSRKYFRLLSQPLDPKYQSLILDDVKRTFPTHELFLTFDETLSQVVADDEGHTKLSRILHAYAVLDPECGYVQGMSYIAAVPLFYMVEEDAFWVFVYIMIRLGYREYFVEGTPQLGRTNAWLEQLIQGHLPRLSTHLRDNGIALSAFTSKWFLTIYTFVLPFPIALRCWDWLFISGHDALLVIAVTILKLKQNDLLALTDTDDLLESVMGMVTKVDIRATEFIDTAQSFRGILKEVEVMRLRNEGWSRLEPARQAQWEAAIQSSL